MMIDNPKVIREVVKKTNAYATHASASKMINDDKFMESLDNLSEEFKLEADKAWKEMFK
jgi:hypothetical protein